MRSASSPIVGRKLRGLALHGPASNSNIIKFQIARLRRLLGGEVEWLTPDAPVPWEPRQIEGPEELNMKDFFTERSDIEKRLANGKRFATWYTIEGDDNALIASISSVVETSEWLFDYISNNAPIDFIIACSQPAALVISVAETFQALSDSNNFQLPWRINIFFGGFPPVDVCHSQSFTEPTFVVISKEDHYYGHAMHGVSKFENVEILEHKDPSHFPMTEPNAQHIFEHLADKLRKYLGLPEPQAVVSRSVASAQKSVDKRRKQVMENKDWHSTLGVSPDASVDSIRKAFLECALLYHPDKLGNSSDTELFRRIHVAYKQGLKHVEQSAKYCVIPTSVPSTNGGVVDEALREAIIERIEAWENGTLDVEGIDPDDVEIISCPDLAEMLLLGSCIVIDMREPHERRGYNFPGAQHNLSFLSVRLRPWEGQKTLKRLLDDGRLIVVVSLGGTRCRRFCPMLIDLYGFSPDRVARLTSGINSWGLWEQENLEQAQLIRRSYRLTEQPLFSEMPSERKQSISIELA